MKITSLFKTVACILFSFLPGGYTIADAVNPHSAAATQALMELLQPLHNLQGNFTQRQVSTNGEVLADTVGSFSLQRPNRLRWETAEPFPQLLVSDGATLWLFDPDLQQVTVSDVTQQLDQTPAVIFAGDVSAIEENYFVSRAAAESQSFTLVPREEGSQFRKLELGFANDELASMTVLDGFGQTTTFRFTGLKTNQPLDKSLFRFSPPPGVDILRNE